MPRGCRKAQNRCIASRTTTSTPPGQLCGPAVGTPKRACQKVARRGTVASRPQRRAQPPDRLDLHRKGVDPQRTEHQFDRSSRRASRPPRIHCRVELCERRSRAAGSGEGRRARGKRAAPAARVARSEGGRARSVSVLWCTISAIDLLPMRPQALFVDRANNQ